MTLVELAKKLRPLIEQAAQSLTDETAVDAVSLFPSWQSGIEYTAGQRVRYDGVLYTVLQTHASQDTWQPDTASSLFAKVLIPDDNIIPEWEQPNATNAYKKGDMVMFEDAVYESLIDNNVWSPSAYPAGWKIVNTEARG